MVQVFGVVAETTLHCIPSDRCKSFDLTNPSIFVFVVCGSQGRQHHVGDSVLLVLGLRAFDCPTPKVFSGGIPQEREREREKNAGGALSVLVSDCLLH